MTYHLKIYPRMMIIENSDYHAVFNDGRWELYINDLLVAYADNAPLAQAKLLDRFEADTGVRVADDG